MKTKLAAAPIPLSKVATIDLASERSIEVMEWAGLNSFERAAWVRLRSMQPEFVTPFFSLEFFDAVQAARGDVRVAVIRDGAQIVGFFPFHRTGKIATPAGRYFNDAHNIIVRPGTLIDWSALLKACDVKSYDFHAMVGSVESVDPKSIHGTTQSFRADIGDDSHAFLASLERQHRTIRKQDQKTRAMARDLGPLRLEFDCRDESALRTMIDWKRDQYHRTNILDLFTPDWTRRMVTHLHQTSDRPMRGLLSVLWAGDALVSTHFGMIEGDLLHYWFPTYNVTHGRYSPGTALFKSIVRDATENGLRVIDMGYGEQPYKRKQTDTITTVHHGSVSNCPLHRSWCRMRLAMDRLAKQMPMKESLKRILRTVKPDAGIGKLG